MGDSGPWAKLIHNLAADADFATGAPTESIAAAERALELALPSDLAALLRETDGVHADLGASIIWSCAELAQQNTEFRTSEGFRELYMPFDHLLFFGDDGGGSQFAFAITADGKISKGDVYRWDHETDGREWFSGSLRQYLEFRLGPRYYER